MPELLNSLNDSLPEELLFDTGVDAATSSSSVVPSSVVASTSAIVGGTPTSIVGGVGGGGVVLGPGVGGLPPGLRPPGLATVVNNGASATTTVVNGIMTTNDMVGAKVTTTTTVTSQQLGLMVQQQQLRGPGGVVHPTMSNAPNIGLVGGGVGPPRQQQPQQQVVGNGPLTMVAARAPNPGDMNNGTILGPRGGPPLMGAGQMMTAQRVGQQIIPRMVRPPGGGGGGVTVATAAATATMLSPQFNPRSQVLPQATMVQQQQQQQPPTQNRMTVSVRMPAGAANAVLASQGGVTMAPFVCGGSIITNAPQGAVAANNPAAIKSTIRPGGIPMQGMQTTTINLPPQYPNSLDQSGNLETGAFFGIYFPYLYKQKSIFMGFPRKIASYYCTLENLREQHRFSNDSILFRSSSQSA